MPTEAPAGTDSSAEAAALPNATTELARSLKLSRTVAAHLCAMGYSDPRAAAAFLEPRLGSLTSPEHMRDRVHAAERIAEAIRSRTSICVYGDYDCDGITSTAITTEAVRALGGEAHPLLASRFDGGYGVTPQAVERIVATGASLLVCCDCGSSDHAALAQLREHGIDCIVIDHHLVPVEPLPALAFLNPHRPDCGFPYKNLASCGLALSLCAALRSAMGVELDVRRWLDLVAIGTIADVAPLDGDNRALVRAGLGALRVAERPAIKALLSHANIDAKAALTAEDVAFRIAPRLNAPGRMGEATLSLELLLASSDERARELAERLEQLTNQRKAAQEKMLTEAKAEVEREGYADRSGIMLGREGWNHGIVGIVAGRLASRYGKPVGVIGFEGGHGRGSLRGPAGSRLHDALSSLQDVLIRFGGHQAAAGLEVRIERLEELRARFESACSAVEADAETGQRDAAPLVELHHEDAPSKVMSDLVRLEPCGCGNPAPKLSVTGNVSVAREVRGGHLKLELEMIGGRRIGGFGPNLGERANGLGGHVRVTGKLRPDRYRGGDAVELLVEALEQL